MCVLIRVVAVGGMGMEVAKSRTQGGEIREAFLEELVPEVRL